MFSSPNALIVYTCSGVSSDVVILNVKTSFGNSQHLGHMTKMAATAIYGEAFSKFFSRISGLISIKFGMKHALGIQAIKVCSNDDPGLTLTYFTMRSNFVT